MDSKQKQKQKPSLLSCSIIQNISNHLNAHLPNFARIQPLQLQHKNVNRGVKEKGMTNEAIEERLGGVFVYALTTNSQGGSFTLLSPKTSTKNSLALFCMKQQDAQSLLNQIKSMDPTMRRSPDACVIPVALNKVFQLKVNGVAFRLIPEAIQVQHAFKERENAGLSLEDFTGVPVFQSQSLVLRSGEKSYRPVFFRKEDLEKSLSKASKQQGRLNPIFRRGDVEVAALEDIIKGMKDDSSQKWDDVVFIPPGFDVSTDPLQSQKSPAK